MLICGYRVLEQEVKEKVNDRFDEEQDLSQVSIDIPSRVVELNPQQREIYQNLKSIGTEIAAYYLDGIKILHSKDLETAASLLGHIAKEIDSGLKHLLPTKEDVNKISKLLDGKKFGFALSSILAALTLDIDDLQSPIPLTNQDKERIKKVLIKKGLDRSDYIASIFTTLNLDIENLPSSDVVNRIDIAIRWIDVSTRFNDFDHQHGVGKPPRPLHEFVPLWQTFESVLADLVGNYLNFFRIIDPILGHKNPTQKIKDSLPNIIKLNPLEAGPRYRYFFENLEHLNWLELLYNLGYFNPEFNPPPQEVSDKPGYYRTSVWYALEYVVKAANHTKNRISRKQSKILVSIIDEIIKCADNYEDRIQNEYTDLQTIKILVMLPVDQLNHQHISFISTILKSERRFGLVDQKIGGTILPKLLNAGAEELTLILLKVMLDAKVVKEEYPPEITDVAKESTLDLLKATVEPGSVNRQIIADVEAYEPKDFNREITYMQEYWLRDALKEHVVSVAKLCGVKAANIALDQIRTLIAEGVDSFDRIQMVGVESPDAPHENYAELLVGFVSGLFRFAKPTEIVETVENLLQAPQTIIKRIALNAVIHHYNDLKRLFWEWDGNPLEEINLKPELYQLIQTNCTKFNRFEIEQILNWIELAQYTPVFARDDETRIKAIAYKRREWLSALLETGNDKVISAYQKYKQINPERIEHPGLNRWTEIWAGSTSPLTVEKLSGLSNSQIAQYLINFKETEVFRRIDPTERGLAKTLEKCVEADPQKFTDNLLPFQDVRNLYQSSILHGFLDAWRNKKEFDWAALLKFIDKVLSLKQFWTEHYDTGFNYRNWVFSASADLVAEGTKSDKHAFDAELLPLAEKILLVLVKKAQQSVSTLNNLSTDVLNSDRSKVFSAMINYALRFARINENVIGGDYRWPQAIRTDFTKRLDRTVEPSLEFSYTLGIHLPYLSYLDKEWVLDNIDNIFPQHDEDHWQAAFSGYLFYPRILEEFYSLLKAHGHYQKALTADFANADVSDRFVKHVCTGWIEGSEILEDKTSLVYQLIHSGNPNLLSGVVYFFLRQSDNLSDKVKAKIMPAWRALFQVLSENQGVTAYQQVSCPLLGWLELVDTIDTEVLDWVKGSIEDIDKVPGYYMTLSRFFKALQKHAPKTPKLVGEIYLEIPQRVIRYLQTEEEKIKETVRILNDTGYKDTAKDICIQFVEAGAEFLKPVYVEF